MAFDLSMPILVVDDYNTMIRIIRNLLKQIGFDNVDDASDGSAALAKMQGKKYGLVISDWNMEPMTGYDLLREVRADPNLATTPFIMITARWPRWTPSKLPIAITVPLGISAAGVASRITVKSGVIFRNLRQGSGGRGTVTWRPQ